MARRRSLNRRRSRQSMNITELEPNSEVFDNSDPLWWKNIDGEITRRQSRRSSYGNTTGSILNEDTANEVSNLPEGWWKGLDKSETETLPRVSTRNSLQNSKTVHESFQSDDTDDISVKKKKSKAFLATRGRGRKSSGTEKFIEIIKDTIVSSQTSSKGQDRTKDAEKSKGKRSWETENDNITEASSDNSSEANVVLKSRAMLFRRRGKGTPDELFDEALSPSTPVRSSPRRSDSEKQKELMGPPKSSSVKKKSIIKKITSGSEDSEIETEVKKQRPEFGKKKRKVSSVNPFDDLLKDLNVESEPSQEIDSQEASRSRDSSTQNVTNENLEGRISRSRSRSSVSAIRKKSREKSPREESKSQQIEDVSDNTQNDLNTSTSSMILKSLEVTLTRITADHLSPEKIAELEKNEEVFKEKIRSRSRTLSKRFDEISLTRIATDHLSPKENVELEKHGEVFKEKIRSRSRTLSKRFDDTDYELPEKERSPSISIVDTESESESPKKSGRTLGMSLRSNLTIVGSPKTSERSPKVPYNREAESTKKGKKSLRMSVQSNPREESLQKTNRSLRTSPRSDSIEKSSQTPKQALRKYVRSSNDMSENMNESHTSRKSHRNYSRTHIFTDDDISIESLDYLNRSLKNLASSSRKISTLEIENQEANNKSSGVEKTVRRSTRTADRSKNVDAGESAQMNDSDISYSKEQSEVVENSKNIKSTRNSQTGRKEVSAKKNSSRSQRSSAETSDSDISYSNEQSEVVEHSKNNKSTRNSQTGRKDASANKTILVSSRSQQRSSAEMNDSDISYSNEQSEIVENSKNNKSTRYLQTGRKSASAKKNSSRSQRSSAEMNYSDISYSNEQSEVVEHSKNNKSTRNSQTGRNDTSAKKYSSRSQRSSAEMNDSDISYSNEQSEIVENSKNNKSTRNSQTGRKDTSANKNSSRSQQRSSAEMNDSDISYSNEQSEVVENSKNIESTRNSRTGRKDASTHEHSSRSQHSFFSEDEDEIPEDPDIHISNPKEKSTASRTSDRSISKRSNKSQYIEPEILMNKTKEQTQISEISKKSNRSRESRDANSSRKRILSSEESEEDDDVHRSTVKSFSRKELSLISEKSSKEERSENVGTAISRISMEGRSAENVSSNNRDLNIRQSGKRNFLPMLPSRRDLNQSKKNDPGQSQITNFFTSKSVQKSVNVVIGKLDPVKLKEAMEKAEEIKQQRLKLIDLEMEAAKKTAEAEKTNKKPTSRVPKEKKVKAVDKAYIVNGQVYKRPRLPRPKPWVTDRLYRYLWKCMEPKFGLSTRLKSEKFVVRLSEIVAFTTKQKKYNNYKTEIDELMREMAKLGIIKTRNDFYDFCYEYLPYDFRVKVSPMILPGNIQNIPYDPKTLHTPILRE